MFSQTLPVLLIVFAIIIIVIALRPQLRIAVPDDFSVHLEAGGGMAVTLVRKGWGFTSFKKIAGTVTIRNPTTSHYTVSPSEKTTTATAPDALFSIQPSSVGASSVQIWGNSSYGSHQGVFSSGPWVEITVRA